MANPWQVFIDGLTAKGNIDKAAIVSKVGDSIWAASPDFEVQLDELKVIVSILNQNEAAKQAAFEKGIYLAKERYLVLDIIDRSIYARGCKKDGAASNEKTGIHLAKTEQAIIIGHHNAAKTRQDVTPEVEGLADHFVKLKY